MKKQIALFELYVMNAIIYTSVFFAALGLSVFALARKINSYDGSQNPIILNVKKPEIVITNPVSGRIDEIDVQAGQRIHKGDLLIKLSDPSNAAKLATLKQIAPNNVSAMTEAKVLEANQSFYQIYAPSDGVIYQINVTAGSFINQNTQILVMYSNDDIRLVGDVNAQIYDQLSKEQSITVSSYRFGQNYQVELDGAGRVIPATQFEESKYELQFHFADLNEGAAFIQGEGLQVVDVANSDSSTSTAQEIANYVKAFVDGSKK